MSEKRAYPPTNKIDHVDDYHGTEVADPYRWMEDPDSAETQEWVEEQNALTFAYLETIPQREAIKERLTALWNFPKSQTFKQNGRYLQLRNTGLQNQDVLYVLEGPEDEEGRMLLDPNTLSEDGTVALVMWDVSDDGKKLAYATISSGSDWLTWHVRDIESGEDLPDVIHWSKFAGSAWLPDGSGFFYAGYDAPEEGQALTGTNYYHKVYLHKLGTPQEDDDLIYERPDQKGWMFSAHVTCDGRYLILDVHEGTDIRNGIFYKEWGTDNDFVKLLQPFEATFDFVGSDGTVFYFLTTLDAPRGRLLAVDAREPARENWRTIIPEGEDVLRSAHIINAEFIAHSLHDAHSQLKLYTKDGEFLSEIELPTLGAVESISGDPDDVEMFFTFTSFVYPETTYHYEFGADSLTAIAPPPLTFDPEQYETEQIFAESKDGTRVPVFITRRTDAQTPLPTILYGYGGFNIPVMPRFQPAWLAWLEMGGALAVANLRGGGEYGDAWHEAGMIHNKQNVFDDFIGAAEHLISEGLTTSAKLAIQGASNGGLLVGACMTQRPDLFGAALPSRGVMDMLRFHKFTIGWAWVSDYGSADDVEHFKTLYAYSPVHNVKPANYPATLVTTADHDDRVVPAHSYKFIAQLQSVQEGEAPVMIRIQTKAGHGMGIPTSKRIEERADELAFLVQALEMD